MPEPESEEPDAGDGAVEIDLGVTEQSSAADQKSPISDDADSEYGDDEESDGGLSYPCQRR